ncbi:hypothetical protein J2Z50_002663 [Ensifer mexicanus]|nr:hypothetical protein [Sinorhizobium mexicanum]
MRAYLSYPEDEIGYDLARSYPQARAWPDRLTAVPGWQEPYDLLPGQRLPRFRRANRAGWSQPARWPGESGKNRRASGNIDACFAATLC